MHDLHSRTGTYTHIPTPTCLQRAQFPPPPCPTQALWHARALHALRITHTHSKQTPTPTPAYLR